MAPDADGQGMSGVPALGGGGDCDVAVLVGVDAVGAGFGGVGVLLFGRPI
jgi:hypothetical protein